MKDASYHYTPNIFILSCRYNMKSKNTRKKTERKKKRGFLILDKINTHLEKEVYTVNQEDESIYEEDTEVVKEKIANMRKI